MTASDAAVVAGQFITDLLAFTQREFISLGATHLDGSFFSYWLYWLPLATLFFAALRQLTGGRWPLGLVLLGMTLYFAHNRMTVFAAPHATIASTVGNACLLLLGMIYLLPPAWRRLIIREER